MEPNKDMQSRGGKQAKLKMSLGCQVATLMNCAEYCVMDPAKNE